MTFFTLSYRDLWSGQIAESKVAAGSPAEAVEKLYKSLSDTLATSGEDAPRLVGFDDGTVDLDLPERVNNAWYRPDEKTGVPTSKKMRVVPTRRKMWPTESEF